MAQVKITIREPLEERLQAEADRIGKTKAEAARLIIEEHFAGESLRSVRQQLEQLDRSLTDLTTGLDREKVGGDVGSQNAHKIQGQVHVLACAVEILVHHLLPGHKMPQELRDKFEMVKHSYKLK